MARLNPIDQQDGIHQSRWLIGAAIVFCLVFTASILLSSNILQHRHPPADPMPASDYRQAQLDEDIIHEAHDELFMLVISMLVVVQVVATFKVLQRLPYHWILLGAFAATALSAVCTVVEGFFLPEVLNYIEHLSMMSAAILLAVWCGIWAFSRQPQEGD